MTNLDKNILTSILLMSLILVLPISAASAASVSIEDANAPVGENTTAQIVVHGVTNLTNFALRLSYDPSVVMALSAENNPNFPSDMMGESLHDFSNAADGYVVLLSTPVGATPESGDDVLLTTVTLHAVGGDSCPLGLTIYTLKDSDSADITLDSVINGTFTVETTGPTLTAFTVEPATVKQGESVEIDIAFSEEVSWVINVNNSTSTVQSWNGASTNPTKKYWDTTTETPTGEYTLDVFMNDALVGTETVTVEVASTEPTYGVTISQPDDQTTYEGVNATYLLTVTNTGNVADTYALDVTNIDSATTASLNITSITLDAAASGVVALDVTNTVAGTFNVTASATSMNATNTTGNIITTVEVASTEPTYGVTISQPDDQTTYEGVNATYLLTVTNTGNVADTYALDVTNIDSATTASLNITSITLDAAASGVVALDVTNTVAGTFNVTASATSMNATNTTGNIITTVEVASTEPTYGVTISQPDDQTTYEGVNATYLLTVTNTGNVADTYALDVTNIDSATTASLNITSITLDAAASGVVALDVTNTVAGTFNVTASATSMNATNTTGNIITTVEVASTEPTYGVTISQPDDQTTYEGVNATYLLTVTNTGNVADTYALDVTNIDSATTASLNITSITLDAAASGVVALDVTNTVAGTFNVTVSATSMNATNTTGNIITTVEVASTEPTYGVTISQPDDQTTYEGVNATYLLTVTNTGNVADTYALDVTNIDSATTASLNITSITLDAAASGVVALDVTNTVAGTFNVTSSATSMNATNTTGNIITTVEVAGPPGSSVSIEDANASVGENTTAQIVVHGVTNLTNFALRLSYDPSVVMALSAENNPNFPSDMMGESLHDFSNAADGYVVLLSTPVGATPESGDDVLLTTVTLHAVGGDSCPLGLTIYTLKDSDSADITLDSVINGTFTVETTGPTLTAFTVEPATVKQGESVEIDIAFSEEVSWVINVNNSTSTVQSWNGASTNPTKKYWDTTTETPTGEYTVDVFMNDALVGTETVTVEVASTEPTYGVTISQPDDQATYEGVNATYLLTVTNTGNVADTYALDVTNIDSATTASLNITSITLDASASGVVALDVTNTVAGTFNVTSSATSMNATNTTGNIITTVEVAGPPGSSVSIEDANAPVGENTTAQIVVHGVTNLTNFALRLSYDPSVVMALSAENNPNFPSDMMGESLHDFSNAADGYVVLLSTPVGATSESGDDVLLTTVTLHAVGGDSCPLGLTIYTLKDSDSADITLDSVINGTFTVETTEPTYSVTISQPDNQPTPEGVNATYLLTVENTGTVADTYNLVVMNIDGATTAALNMTTIALDAGASGVVALDVTNTTAGTFNVTVNATSLNATNTTGYIMTTVVEAVSAEYDVTISQPDNQTTPEGVNATYLLTVENTGTVADTYNLVVMNIDGATTAALNMTTIALDAGASGVVALDVTNTTAGTFNVTVNATSLNATNTTGYIMTTVVPPTYGVTISQPDNQTTYEGVNATYLLTVTNTGNVADIYTLNVTNIDGATTAALNLTSITLDAGASGVVALDVTNTAAGTFNVNVTAESPTATNTTGNIMTTVEVKPVDTGGSGGSSGGSGTYPPGWNEDAPTPAATPAPTTAAPEPTVAPTDAAPTEAPTDGASTVATTEAPTETPTTKLPTKGTPGFGATLTVFVIAGLLVATYLVMRRRE